MCNTDMGIYDLYISDFVYIGDLRSGQFRDLVISQWGQIEGSLMRIRSAQLTQNHNQIGYA